MKKNEILVFIPTYNEQENVREICSRLLNLSLDLDILFIDDDSPDGTGDVLDQLAKQHSNLHVIHRAGKLGIGSAHLDGISWAYDNGYSTLITMDCDFTHKPETIPEFLQQSDDHDIVIGSRFLHKESLREWNLYRKAFIHLGHFLTRKLLRLRYDATGAFRLYNLEKIPSEMFNLIESESYSFFFESLFILNLNGIPIKQISIDLPARTYGHSKQSFNGAFKTLLQLICIFLTSRTNVEKFKYFDISSIDFSNVKDQQGWDDYWKRKKTPTSFVYDTISAIYRKLIIKRSLNFFIKKHFSKNTEILHAGCGSGQVDVDIRDYISITAFDISPEALIFYKRVNADSCQLIHGDLFDISKEDESFDGIYNLGVFEHFSHAELQKILNEFHRILRPGGKIIIFWPPRFGFSVIVLRMIHFVLNDILKKNVKLHPDEPSLLKSKEQAENLLLASKFQMIDYYFGIKDLFTQSVVVGQKNESI